MPYDEAQRFPAGEYVLQAKACTGLAEWTREVGRGTADYCRRSQEPACWAITLLLNLLRRPAADGAWAQTAPQDASLEGADPVIWYAFGVTHVVRPEDFPVMPCEWVAPLRRGWATAAWQARA
jgi:primary-amine oxidase